MLSTCGDCHGQVPATAAEAALRPQSAASKTTFPKESSLIRSVEVNPVLSEFDLALQRLRSLHEESLVQLQAKLRSLDTNADDVACEAGSPVLRLPERHIAFEESEPRTRKDPEFVVEKDVADTTPVTEPTEGADTQEDPYDRIRMSQIDLNNKLMELDQEFARTTGTKFFQIDRSQLSVTYLVRHPLFNLITAFMIIVNAIQIGYDAELTATTTGSSPLWMNIWSLVCTLYFAVECTLRIWTFRREFFCGEAWPWNLFDLLLVVCSAADFAPFLYGDAESSIVLDALRALKLLRIIRVFRVFRVIKQLSNLMVMIADSINSLLWALVMLVIIMYVFAVCIMTFTSDWVATSSADDPVVGRIQDAFGSLGQSFFTLVVVMLDGVDFADILEDLLLVGWMPFALLMFFVLFTNLAVLNVVTGVFVDRALEAEKSQREYQVERALKNQISFKKQIIHLVAKIDSNADGRITRDELHAMLEDRNLSAHWETLGLVGLNRKLQADRLFNLVDEDSDGAIYVDEFLDKAGFLRGPASAIELLAVQSECNQIRKQLRENRKVLQRLVETSLPQDLQHGMGQAGMLSAESLDPAELNL